MWGLLFAGSEIERTGRSTLWKSTERLVKSFLKKHRPGVYSSYLLTGKLTAHLNEVDQQANERMKMLVDQTMERQAITEELKVRDQMEWVGAVNNIQNVAEEIVLKEIVYCINN